MRIVGEIKDLPVNMEENKNSDERGTQPQTSYVFVEKTDWRWFTTNCSRTFCKTRTNYTNIVFVNWFPNKMFASVYVTLCFTTIASLGLYGRRSKYDSFCLSLGMVCQDQ